MDPLPRAERSAAGQYVTFFIGDDEYAIDILRLREIVELRALTRVPGTPPWILGVMSLHGSVLPVVDLGLRFGLGERALTRFTCVVVVEVALDGQPLGLGVRADRISRVLELDQDDVQPPPPFGTRVRLDYLLGMAKSDERFALLLDTERVLSLDELLQVSELGGPTEPSDARDAG
jgi:purine-binding chemotaxis protein CheW